MPFVSMQLYGVEPMLAACDKGVAGFNSVLALAPWASSECYRFLTSSW